MKDWTAEHWRMRWRRVDIAGLRAPATTLADGYRRPTTDSNVPYRVSVKKFRHSHESGNSTFRHLRQAPAPQDVPSSEPCSEASNLAHMRIEVEPRVLRERRSTFHCFQAEHSMSDSTRALTAALETFSRWCKSMLARLAFRSKSLSNAAT